MDQMNMAKLTLAEMKRTIEILEAKVDSGKPISKTRTVPSSHRAGYTYDERDPYTAELLHTFKSIRRHTVALEKLIKEHDAL
jgi:hypothetical protein